jgi:hypothetical protein
MVKRLPTSPCHRVAQRFFDQTIAYLAHVVWIQTWRLKLGNHHRRKLIPLTSPVKRCAQLCIAEARSRLAAHQVELVNTRRLVHAFASWDGLFHAYTCAVRYTRTQGHTSSTTQREE